MILSLVPGRFLFNKTEGEKNSIILEGQPVLGTRLHASILEDHSSSHQM